MDRLIQNLKQHLETKNTGLVYVDEDWGQVDSYDNLDASKFPCALLELQEGEFSNDGKLRQRGKLTVVVKFFPSKLAKTLDAVLQSEKDKITNGWNVCKKINQALHGQRIGGESFSAFTRTAMKRVKRDDGLFELDVTYVADFIDVSCVPVETTVMAAPRIKNIY